MSASAGAWGARVGPPAIRRALDSGRTSAFLTVVAVSLVALTFFGGVGVVGVALGEPVVVLFFGLPAVGAAQVVLTAACRWWWARRPAPGPVLLPAPSGAPATAYLRSRAALLPAAATGLGTGAWGLAMLVAGLVAGSTWPLVVGVLLLAGSSLLWLPLFAGAGGLYLTVDGVEHRWGVDTVAVPWDELRAPSPVLPVGLRVTPGSRRRRGLPLVLPVDTVDQAPPGEAPVPPAFLPLTLTELSSLLARPQREPALRAGLGRPESLGWLAPRRGVVEL